MTPYSGCIYIRKKIKKITAGILAAAVLLGGTLVAPVPAQAAVEWTQLPADDQLYPGAKSAEDSKRYVYILPKNATTKKGCTVVAYFGESKNIKLSGKIGGYKITNLGTAFTSLTSIRTLTIPSGYTTIESQAFNSDSMGMGALYRISFPASVKHIADDAIVKYDPNKLTIVAPYGSVAEKYAFIHGIHYTNNTSVQVQSSGTSMYVGEKKTIAVLNTDKDVTWKSSNKSVATVNSDGVVTAKKAGSTKISATVGGRTFTDTYKVVTRTQDNVLGTIWSNYVTASMSDYEKAVAAEQWVASHIDASGTSSSVKTALEKGKVNYTGRANAYKKILEHYGLKVTVVKGNKHVENSVVIAGKTYPVPTLAGSSTVDQEYTTTSLGGVAINKSTMNLSVGGTDTFQALGTKQKITYSSSNKKVATVTTSGKVTAKGAGIATITMKMGAKTYNVRVRVNK